MMIFKVTNTVDGDEDAMYVEAIDVTDAKDKFRSFGFDLPDSYLIVVAVDKLPAGEELFEG